MYVVCILVLIRETLIKCGFPAHHDSGNADFDVVNNST